MWQTAASATEISTHRDWIFPPSRSELGEEKGGVGGDGERERERERERDRQTDRERGLFTNTLLCQH